MGDILEIITTRRTIKEFIPKFVSWENISRVLDAGRHAPSSGNIQNWRFITVFVPGEKQQLAEACYGQYEVAQAWVLIVICGEPERAIRYYGEKGKHYTVQNCAAAAENMLLEAHSLGLGGRWIGAFDEEAVKSLLGVPPEATVEVIVAVGYPKEIPGKPPKYPLEPIAYFSRWRLRLRDPHKYMNNLAIIMGRRREAAKAALKHVVGSFPALQSIKRILDMNQK
ncbi:nitroreductase family protein [Candidatus Woesearchaeota archaeon]|nr:nitroreductase family protein [Candidatus Woesearchaeota archaeon]